MFTAPFLFFRTASTGSGGESAASSAAAAPPVPPPRAPGRPRIFRATVVHSTDVGALDVLPGHCVGVREDGSIAFVGPASSESAMRAGCGISDGDWEVVTLADGQWLMPGLVDAHVHASQYPYTGTGYDLQLLDWLLKYTFPTEARYADREYALEMYRRAVRRHLANGTTTACYFATIHREGTMALVDAVAECGQRAFVGKVCMDRNAPDFYVETTRDSVEDTAKFVSDVQALRDPLIEPVITPRFVPTCTHDLMTELGALARRKQVLVQSHLSESQSEIAWVRELHPLHASYTDVYDDCGLLNPRRCVMAHCVHLSDEEIATLRDRRCGVAHCASSNFNLMSGVMPIRKLLASGVAIGLGTDVAGGHSPSVLDAARQAITASKVRHIADKHEAPLSWAEALSLATLGGARALGIDDKVGSFEPGKCFDAVVIDPSAASSPIDVVPSDTIEDVISKFVYLGDDRNFAAVYVNGVDRLPGLRAA